MSESGSTPDPVTAASAHPGADRPVAGTGAADGAPGGAAEPKDPLRGSRAGGVWVAVVVLVVLLILLSVFILQNTRTVEVSYFGATGEAPLAAALLIAVAAGMLIAVVVGSLRILQLRRRVRHEQKR